MSKNYSDLTNGLNKLVTDSENRKTNKIGDVIMKTHDTPDYSDKQTVLIKISELYSAPSKWNFYDRLDDNKKIELMESIQETGILSPIVVWEINRESMIGEYTGVDDYNLVGNRFMILAGHNRVDAFIKLYATTKNEEYLKIPTMIFNEKDLDIQLARGIIIDTNYVQRKLSTKEKVKSVMYKYAEFKNNKTRKGKTKELIAEELNMSPTTVFYYMKLSNVIDQIQEKVYKDELALTSVLKICDRSKDVQIWIYENYKDVLNNKVLNKIKPYMKKEHIEDLFKKEFEIKIVTKKIITHVPVELEDKFKKMCDNWIYNQLNSDK